MKKVLIGIVVLIAIAGGGAFYVFSNIGDLVKETIETAGTDAVGSAVTVGSVEIDLMGGSASIYDFSIANPAGYSNQAMVSFAELSIALDLNNISGSIVGIHSIVAREPFVLYESVDGTSNLDTVNARFASEEGAAPQSESSSNVPDLAIGSILIESIRASLSSGLLSEPIEVSLGDIRLENLQGSPEEISSQIMQPVISQLTASAGSALLSAIAGMDLQEAQEAVMERVDEELEDLEDTVNEKIDEVLGEDIREGLGNLLGR